MRLGRMAQGRFQPLAGRGNLAPLGVSVSFSELAKPRADGVKPGVDLLPTAGRGLWLVVHASQHA